MTQKRLLVWLSADPQNIDQLAPLQADWDILPFDYRQPLPLKAEVPSDALVGLVQPGPLEESEWPRLESWLEALDLSAWIALLPTLPAPQSPVSQLVRRYCADFHTEPLDYRRLGNVLGHLHGMARLRSAAAITGIPDYRTIVLNGQSDRIRSVRLLLRRFAESDAPVLITGEPGTGKDAAARFLHDHSPRASGPFVVVNCAALPASLTQSELFGHEKGAFTHALSQHQGKLELAHQGTLVFSGIDELTLAQQSSLLRFLQEGQIERLGGSKSIQVDARIVSTCCTPLPQLIEEKRFRSDVFYRIGSLEIRMPPLRQRADDIPALTDELLTAIDGGEHPLGVSKAARQALMTHSWPGNVRELQNRLRQAQLLHEKAVIQPQDLGLSSIGPGTDQSIATLTAFRDRADREALAYSLALTRHNVSAAARLLGISRVSFYRLMEKHNGNRLRHPQTRQKGSPS
ncbi:sigma-54 dependent transcription regulator [Marinobacter santoriniensis NKSG1]|uniref:Sigma-54 dependent transcription regulator n=1 Tax=Marinobacter santoriniensis NKSG1 TaxID=1288826 RepID=M7CPU3_9GAMM|nr:sigma-54 dependent transcriptional regulator [Marinobacter santoriniensis]EMP55189.1 sigma-54 dependent transcription regulator [Marinobacter santoriniensis NKSG1]